jgi:hypothetical protein
MLAALRPRLLRQRERQLNEEALIFVKPLREMGLAVSDEKLRRIARAILAATNSLLPYYLTSKQLGARSVVARRAKDVAVLVVSGAISVLRSKTQARR